jgi:hypothetical protein
MFVGLAQAGRNSGLWPVVSEQTGSLLLILAVALRSREPLRVTVRAAGWPVLVGASGMTATLLYFYATHFSMLATAAVLVSLYPGVTVLLARTIPARAVQPGPARRPRPVHPRRHRDRAELTVPERRDIVLVCPGRRRRQRGPACRRGKHDGT